MYFTIFYTDAQGPGSETVMASDPDDALDVFYKENAFFAEWLDTVEIVDVREGTHYDNVPDDSMDGDHASALASCGYGTDEDYGCYGDGGEY